MEALKKLHAARQLIKQTALKKAGWNSYSEYAYFTPQQISELTSNPDFGLFNKFDLVRTDLGLIGRLTITDLESGKSIIFEMATEIPSIKATNIAQQLGGAMTYTERYLRTAAYEITDNNLDFDTTEQTKKTNKPTPKTALPELTPDHKYWDYTVKRVKEGIKMDEIKKSFIISEENAQELILQSQS
jgi:hypothetical protein